MQTKHFLTEVHTSRKYVRQKAEEVTVTSGYVPGRRAVLKLLNDLLATMIICLLRYRRHYSMAKGIASTNITNEFLAHAGEELGHVDLIAERIVQLGGEPNFSPDSLSKRSHTEYIEADSLANMIKEDLIAVRISIASYGEVIQYLGDQDPQTRYMLESILAVEEKHAEVMAHLLGSLPPRMSRSGVTSAQHFREPKFNAELENQNFVALPGSL